MHMNHASQSTVFYFVWKCHYVALFMLSRSIIVTISYSVASEARTELDRATTEVTEQVGKWQLECSQFENTYTVFIQIEADFLLF